MAALTLKMSYTGVMVATTYFPRGCEEGGNVLRALKSGPGALSEAPNVFGDKEFDRFFFFLVDIFARGGQNLYFFSVVKVKYAEIY